MSALSTDLYELTMMAGYYVAGMDRLATFELYVRDLPDSRRFLVAAGLEQALEFLENVRFRREEIEYVRGLPAFRHVPARFFDDYLPAFRFTGEVWAVEEGTPVFAHEPLLRVTAPLMEAQFVETAALASITFQTSIATKAVRIVEAAAGRSVVEYGSRRAHGLEAARFAARASYLAGCHGTSNVEAGFRFGIPVSGTMAHSWVMSFDDEVEAFRRYASLFPETAVFLVDTYDTIAAVRRTLAAGLRPSAVRLDSGDEVALSRAVREMFDAAGLSDAKILLSGDLDEHKIARLLAEGARVDGFGVGTALSTSSDAPALGGIYKLVEIQQADGRWRPTLKQSPGKTSYPGRKQVWRRFRNGRADGDVIALAAEPDYAGQIPLLSRVMTDGRPVGAAVPVIELRERCRAQVAALPEALRRLKEPDSYAVDISSALRGLTAAMSAPFAK